MKLEKETQIFIGVLAGLLIALVYLMVARQNLIDSCEWVDVTMYDHQIGGIMPDYQMFEAKGNPDLHTIRLTTKNNTLYEFKSIIKNFNYITGDNFSAWICDINGVKQLGDFK